MLQDKLLTVFDKDNQQAGRAVILAYSILSPISDRVSLSFHEFGHTSRVRSYGDNAQMHLGNYDANTNNSGYSNFFSYFVNSFKKPYSAGYTSNNATSYDDRQNLVTSAAGVNNEMYLAEKIQDKLLLDNSLHMAYGALYFKGKLSTMMYKCDQSDSSNDKCNMLYYYKKLGYNFKQSDLNKANAIATALSSDSYAFLLSYYNFLQNGKTEVKPFAIGNFLVPNITSYYNFKGISYKADSGYWFNRYATMIFGYERVVSGSTQAEMSVGLKLSYKKYGLFTKTIIGKTSTSEIDLSYNLKKNLTIHLGLDSYSSHSLYGQRNIPTYKDGSKAMQYWTKISFLY